MYAQARSPRPLVLALALVAAASFGGAKKTPTAPGTYEGWGPDIDRIEIVKSFRLGDYTTLTVTPLDTTSTAKVGDADLAAKMAAVLGNATVPFLDGLKKATRLTVADVQPDGGRRTLLVRGKVTVMDPGSRSKRIFVGYGAGAARTEVQGEIVDAATGDVLVRFTQERRSGIETFGRGSSYEEIMKRNLTAIGEDVANLLKEF